MTDLGSHLLTRVLNLASGTSTRASVGSMVQNCAATQGVAVTAQPHARKSVAVRGRLRHTGKFSAGTLMLHMRLKVVDLPTLGMPTRPVCQASPVAALRLWAERLACWWGHRPWRVSHMECVVVAAQGCGPTLAEGLPLSHGQPRRTAALPAFTLFEGRPSSARFSGSCQSKRWAVLSRDSERREEICCGAPQPSSAAFCELTCRGRKGAPL